MARRARNGSLARRLSLLAAFALALALSMAGCVADAPVAPPGPGDGVPPTLRSWIGGYEDAEPSPTLAANLRLSDVMAVSLEGHDGGRITWVGLRIGNPTIYVDSTSWRDSTVTGSFYIPLAGAALDTFTVQVFVRDDEGNRTTVVPTAGHVSVFENVSRPWRAAGYPDGVTASAFSPDRSRLYFAVANFANSPAFDDSRLETLDLQTLSYGTPVALPEFPHAIDLSASGDSLLVALGNHPSLGVVDLARSPGTLTRLALSIDSTEFRGARGVRTTASNTVLVSLARPSPSEAQRVMTVSLATGEQRVRLDALGGRDTDRSVVFVASPDRTQVLAAEALGSGCCAAQLFDDAAGDFAQSSGELRNVGNVAAPTVSDAGTRVLVGSTLYSKSLARLGAYTLPQPLSPAEGYAAQASGSAISPDGEYAYFGHARGVVKVRLADGAVVERIPLPDASNRPVAVLPGNRLLVFGEELPTAPHVTVVDLGATTAPVTVRGTRLSAVSSRLSATAPVGAGVPRS